MIRIQNHDRYYDFDWDNINKLDTRIKELEKYIKGLEEKNKELKGEKNSLLTQINELQTRLNVNSKNSNFPSSHDLYPPQPSIKQTNSLRKKSNKKVGGQRHHEGKTRTFVKEPDEIEKIQVDSCSCGHNMDSEPILKTIKRQVFDIVYPVSTVKEYEIEVKYCPKCGKEIRGVFPQEVSSSICFGQNIKSLIVFLKEEFSASVSKIQRYLKDVYSFPISTGSIQSIIDTAGKNAEPFTKEVKEEIVKSPIIHCDETGFRVEGKREWTHVVSTPQLTLYQHHPKRGGKAMEEHGILPQFFGIILCDFWKPYDRFPGKKSRCRVHLLRELTYAHLLLNEEWSQKLIDAFWKIYDLIYVSKNSTQRDIDDFLTRYDTCVEEGLSLHPPPKKGKKTKVGNLLLRLKNNRDEIVDFTQNPDIPFTNNLAERDLRKIKLYQKNLGTFRSKKGADGFINLQTYLSTVRKNNGDIFSAIRMLINGTIIHLHDLLSLTVRRS